MSTKIYTASRIPTSKLNDYLQSCRTESIARVVERVEVVLGNIDWDKIAPEVVIETEKRIAEWQVEPENQNKFRRLQMLERLGRQEFHEASNKLEKSIFDVTAVYNVWIDGTFAYLIPYGLAQLPVADYAEDYHYQNQIDRPVTVSEDEWTQRAVTWERICLNDWNATRLEYHVIDFSGTNWSQSIMILERAMKLLPD